MTGENVWMYKKLLQLSYLLGGAKRSWLGGGSHQRGSWTGLGGGNLNLLLRNGFRERQTERWTQRKRCNVAEYKRMEDRGGESRDWQQGERKTRNNQNMFVACRPETVHECKHKVLRLSSIDQFLSLDFLLVCAHMHKDNTYAHRSICQQLYAHQYLLYAYTHIHSLQCSMYNSTGTVLGLGRV